MTAPSSRRAVSPRGFTLIELLTVIAIIGILAAIIIPTVGKVRDTARASQCVSNMRQVGVALRLYADDNKGNLPMASAPNGGWAVLLSPYLPTGTYVGARNPVLICPTNDYETKGTGNLPVAHTYSLGPGSAGLNTTESWVNDSSGSVLRNLSTVRNPSQAVWLMESNIDNLPNKTAFPLMQRSQLVKLSAGDTTGNVALRHGGNARTNITFGDGSARVISPAEFAARYPDISTGPGWRKPAGL